RAMARASRIAPACPGPLDGRSAIRCNAREVPQRTPMITHAAPRLEPNRPRVWIASARKSSSRAKERDIRVSDWEGGAYAPIITDRTLRGQRRREHLSSSNREDHLGGRPCRPETVLEKLPRADAFAASAIPANEGPRIPPGDVSIAVEKE